MRMVLLLVAVLAACSEREAPSVTTAPVAAVKDAGAAAAPPDAPIALPSAAMETPPGAPATAPPVPLDTPEQVLALYSSRARDIGIVTCVKMTSHASDQSPGVMTTVELKPVRAIRGKLPTSIEQAGGSIPGRNIQASDQPKLEVGGTYLMFFGPNEVGGPSLDVALPMRDDHSFRIEGATRTVEATFAKEAP